MPREGLRRVSCCFQDVKFFYPFRPEIQAGRRAVWRPFALGSVILMGQLQILVEAALCNEVLRGVSFQIWAGQSVGLVGPSGGGH